MFSTGHLIDWPVETLGGWWKHWVAGENTGWPVEKCFFSPAT
jgi:hypothetical protein